MPEHQNINAEVDVVRTDTQCSELSVNNCFVWRFGLRAAGSVENNYRVNLAWPLCGRCETSDKNGYPVEQPTIAQR